jgi:hypothetical protein
MSNALRYGAPYGSAVPRSEWLIRPKPPKREATARHAGLDARRNLSYGRRLCGFDCDLGAVGLTFNEIDLVAVELADPDDSVPVPDVAVVQDEIL